MRGELDYVVLLHGLCRSRASMRPMERALVTAGYRVENVGYPSRTNSIAALADAVLGEVMERAAREDVEPVHFVAHSLGGILIRSYFARHPDERLGRVVMLGPPNAGSEIVDRLGSWWAFRTIHGPAGGELGTDPDSVPNRLGPVGFQLGVIAGDRSINWINSLMIAGPNDGKVSVERTKVEGMRDHRRVHATHPFLMRNGSAIALTIRFLRTGSFGKG